MLHSNKATDITVAYVNYCIPNILDWDFSWGQGCSYTFSGAVEKVHVTWSIDKKGTKRVPVPKPYIFPKRTYAINIPYTESYDRKFVRLP
jgi:hypothetical protein